MRAFLFSRDAHEPVFAVAPGRPSHDITAMTRGMHTWRLGMVAALLGFIGFASAPASGQAGVAACVALVNDGERLACYDALFGEGQEIAPAEGVSVASERPIPARPSGREPALLRLACEEGTLRVWFRFAGQNVSNTGDIAPLTYQIDAGGTTVRTLRANADNTELTFSSDADTRTFLDALAGGSSVRVRVTPVRQRSVNVDFRITEVAGEIDALRSSCS